MVRADGDRDGHYPAGAGRTPPNASAFVSPGRYEEIAGRLGISVKTVESHLTRIFERVQVASRTELAMRAMREGWLEAARD